MLHDMARAWVRLAEQADEVLVYEDHFSFALLFGLICEALKKQSRRQWIGGLASSPCAPLTWPRWVARPASELIRLSAGRSLLLHTALLKTESSIRCVE
jgi:hypothetical protein